jgi:hypothetical protein
MVVAMAEAEQHHPQKNGGRAHHAVAAALYFRAEKE